MKVIDKLLEPIPTQQLKDYESHLQLHLKLILTTINKHVLEDTTPVQVPPSPRRSASTAAS